MRRTTIALLAGLEASVAALIGLGIALVPLMLLWAVHFGLAVDATVFLRAAADVWLLGHGVDLIVQLDPVTAGGLGLPGAGDPFPITIAAARLRPRLGGRSGRRIGAPLGRGRPLDHRRRRRRRRLRGRRLRARDRGRQRRRTRLDLAGALLPAFVMAIGVVIGAVVETLRERPLDGCRGRIRPRRAVDALPPVVVDVAPLGGAHRRGSGVRAARRRGGARRGADRARLRDDRRALAVARRGRRRWHRAHRRPSSRSCRTS